MQIVVSSAERCRVVKPVLDPKITVVIPTFNRVALLMEALSAIQRQSLQEFEVFVVDNGPSPDGTAEQVQRFSREDERFTYVSTTDKGMYTAYNIGCRRANADLVLLQDDDWEMTDPDILAYVVRCFCQDERLGVLGISEYYPDGKAKGQVVPCAAPRDWRGVLRDTTLYTPGRINRWGMIGAKLYYLPMGQKHKVDHVRAACMAFRRKVAQSLGYFALVYELFGDGYRAETDLCRRVARAGYDIVFSSEIQGLHKAAPRDPSSVPREQTPKSLYVMGRNHMLFVLRNYWSRPSSVLFFLWDVLVGSSTQPGLVRFVTTHRHLWSVESISASMRGKWRGFVEYQARYHDLGRTT